MTAEITPPTRTSSLELPASGDATQRKVVEGDGVFVVVGANGAGKTRFGTWIESSFGALAHRVAAQKSLTMPEAIVPTSIDRARADLLTGYAAGTEAHRQGSRWNSKPNTWMLNDFDKLLVYLFSDEYEAGMEYRRRSKTSKEYVKPPDTLLDVVKRLWETVLPTRTLTFERGVVTTSVKGSAGQYNASEMSDGERVVFYHIGEALSAPKGGVLIVDEPELHLHKSIQAPLWDLIEGQRPDLAFLYLTHDLEFAASRVGAPKICLQSYDGNAWEWFVAPIDLELPEDVLLQILGARKPVLFVEGDDTSLDYFFLRHAYPKANVVPSGSCEHVIHAVATFTNFDSLHHLKCEGLVDRDQRDSNGVLYLGERGVHVLPVAEIENVFLTEAVLRVIAKRLARPDADGIVAKVKALVLEQLASEKERVVSEIASARIEQALRKFDAKAKGVAAITAALAGIVGQANPAAIYAAAEKEINEIISSADYTRALAVFANKGLVAQASAIFNLKSSEYMDLLRRLAQSDQNAGLLAAIRAALPVINF